MANPTLIEEHANIERSTTQGGYGHRQLYELVQNGADELQKEPGGGIQVVLTRDALYCANLGTPITPEGAETILASHLSRKRGTEIGRFGLGFKSVLSISDWPQFFSRSGSFGWDAARSQEQIRERVPGTGPTPVLRIAHLLDPAEEQRSDPVLAELAKWATTVIRLPLRDGHSDRLARDIKDFPAKFVIFSPHVGEVILEDRRDPKSIVRREIYVRGEGDMRMLFTDEGGKTETSEWMVFEKIHTPTARARREAGEYHDRDRIPLAWAVPVKGQQGPGEFWAFFPTTYATTLRGVLNAPWKTNEDRQNLLKSNSFNEELMRVAAELIVESLPALATPEDPARYLALITARGREARNWADDMLTELVYGTAARMPSLPDQEGVLRRPAEIKLHPERLDKKWLDRWAGYPGRPIDWCHHSVEETTRRSRAEIILERAGRGPAKVKFWLEALVSDGSAGASAVALSIVADMVHQGHPLADEARLARVLRTEDGIMVEPLADTVFRRTPLDFDTGDLTFVDPELNEDPAAGWALSVLGIREADSLGRFAALVRRRFHGYGNDDWERFWALARSAGADQAVRHLTEQRIDNKTLRVRTGRGDFRPLSECLLPGRVIPAGSEEDVTVVVDAEFHRPDIGMLEALGMTDGPRVAVDPSSERWFSQYREQAIGAYYKTLPADVSRPQEHNIVMEGPAPAGPLGMLPRLSPQARSRFLMAIPSVGLESTWKVYAKTRRHDRGAVVQSPFVWMARRHGMVPTTRGLRPVKQCVGLGLKEYGRLLPVVEVEAALATTLSLPEKIEKISGELWRVFLEEAFQSEDAEWLGAFYALAETDLSAPSEIRCRTRDGWQVHGPAEVAVAADRGQYERLIAHDVPAILAPDAEAAARLTEGWGLKPYGEALVTELRTVPAGAPTPLEDVYLQLRHLSNRPLKGLSLLRCSELEELIRTPKGRISRPLQIGRDEETVYYLGDDDDLMLLREINKLLGLGLSEERCKQVLRHREEARKTKRIVDVRRQKDDADRLRTMLPSSVIKEKLPEGLVDHVEEEEGKADDRTIAELALSVHGSGLFREYRPELEEAGFTLPSQMAGGHQARTFVTDLGFSAEFAGFSRPSLDPTVTVEGPVDFPPLHDYQERMVERLAEVLRSRPPLRGMLSLPTGAGKTRVAVEAIIRTMRTLREERSSTPILWIAQTEELCEQAVQTWQFVWRATGPAQRLTISRLWSGNEADPVTSGFHLVIATDAKLEKIIETDAYEWLRNAQAVIVDEAHTSISSRYTQVLSAMGLTPHRTRCPLIGLTATAFRGSEEESDRLAARYGRNRLDYDRDGSSILGENPYLTLQNLGVLARVRHTELKGADLQLDAAERENLEKLRRLPASAEERLGRDTRRNQTLLRQVESLPSDWPVLLFATSVNHARTMAALLNRKGISASSVSGDMDIGVRRHTIDRFKHGNIRVLTNYGVLSQGFDAPATRAVIVARPTYSPNVYQQMIGRGLRGPRNGGKEECLIINVADNIAQYGEELAFRQFDYLWKQS
ncbi:DEAD/DEAH box helicase [Thermomonospora echinospora]|uniref:DEAD/DEAH box helicase n=1 Tax=Thermomonospora echinospora TaxID=1992 RepID=UPI0011B0F359|nr:DEAD/DEAH box helicase family protein [Thermomonospora echinospora]